MAYAGVGAGLEGVLCGLKVEPIDCRLSWAGSLLLLLPWRYLGENEKSLPPFVPKFCQSGSMCQREGGRGRGEDEPTGAGVSQTLGWLSRISIEAETEMPRAMRGEASRVLQLPFWACALID